jgi:hypothetical protein
MSRVLKVANGDYKIQVSNGGTITLDTQAGGAGYGNVVVKGNLDVLGTTTYIETTNTTISDNIFQLNVGQSGSAITGSTGYSGQAGIQISRGSGITSGNGQQAALLFNENINHWDQFTVVLSTVKITGTAGQFSCATTSLIVGATVIISGTINAGSVSGYTTPTTYYIIATNGTTTFTLSTTYNGPAVTTTSSGATLLTATLTATTAQNLAGTFELKTTDTDGSNGNLSGLAIETITNGGGTTDIVFDMRNTTKVLTVANSPSYASYVVRDGDIPTYKFLQNFVASNYGPANPQGTAIVNSLQYPLTGLVVNSNVSIVADSTTIKSYVGTTLISTLASTGVTFGNVQVGGSATPNQISNTSGNNLVLTGTGNRVEISAVLGLDNQGSTPTYTNTGTTLYSQATPGPGKTGLFFVNSVNYNDELVAKNRALLLSILF